MTDPFENVPWPAPDMEERKQNIGQDNVSERLMNYDYYEQPNRPTLSNNSPAKPLNQPKKPSFWERLWHATKCAVAGPISEFICSLGDIGACLEQLKTAISTGKFSELGMGCLFILIVSVVAVTTIIAFGSAGLYYGQAFITPIIKLIHGLGIKVWEYTKYFFESGIDLVTDYLWPLFDKISDIINCKPYLLKTNFVTAMLYAFLEIVDESAGAYIWWKGTFFHSIYELIDFPFYYLKNAFFKAYGNMGWYLSSIVVSPFETSALVISFIIAMVVYPFTLLVK